MNRKIVTKAISVILAFMMLFTYASILGSSVYATVKLEEQETKVDKAEIEFDAYFEEGENKVHTKTIDVEKTDTKLYLDLKVDEGYIKSGNIKIENTNFELKELEENVDAIQSIKKEENKIILNKISKDEPVKLEVPLQVKADSNFNVSDLNKETEVKLEGIYVNNKGKEIKIEKTIKLESIIDGEAKSSLSQEVLKYVSFDVNGTKGVILQTVIKSKLVDNKLPVKQTKLEIEIPQINNQEPKTVTIASKSLMATKRNLTEKYFHKMNILMKTEK